MRRVTIVGFPSSAGSYAAGADLAPAALRASGLVSALEAVGLDVIDSGDLAAQVWRPDPGHPRAQNADLVVSGLRELADHVRPALAAGDTVLVLGGNCTIALPVMAVLDELGDGRPGLAYLDRQYDLNTPASTTDGALDWMGLAHALDLPDCVDELAGAFERRPLLQPEQIAWLGVDPALGTDWERERAETLRLAVTTGEALAADPAGSTRAALATLPAGPLAVHLDVDVLDFTDAPLAENTDGRNSGPSLDQLGRALRVAMSDPRARALSIGELNPTRSAGAPDAIPRFVGMLAAALA